MDERPINRRRFFREGLRELLRPLADTVERLADAAKHFNDLENPPQPPQPEPPSSYTSYNSDGSYDPSNPTHWLRPPGAQPEEQFLSLCSRCGECVRVCPAQCIKIDYAYYSGNGAPYIEPESAACIMCEGIVCSTNCPTNALIPTLREHLSMGTATWNQETCLRTPGADCQVCIDKCPVGASAIHLNGNQIEVLTGCTGCGVCQNQCPTYPKSITITPKSAAS